MEFNGDDSKITGDKAIANGFNNFFVNIGPSLAKRIPKCNDNLFTQYLPDTIDDTMFLQPVTEEEILQLVVNAKSKKSKDHDQFDMCLVKKIIPHIVKPLAHICNTSLLLLLSAFPIRGRHSGFSFSSFSYQLYPPPSLQPQPCPLSPHP